MSTVLPISSVGLKLEASENERIGDPEWRGKRCRDVIMQVAQISDAGD